MEILKLLDDSEVVHSYEFLEYKVFSDGFYIKIKAEIKDVLNYLSENIPIHLKGIIHNIGKINLANC